MDPQLINIKVSFSGKVYKYLVSREALIDDLKDALAKEFNFKSKNDFYLTDVKCEMKKFKLNAYAIKNGSTIRMFPLHITGGIMLVKLPKDKFLETSRCQHLAETHEDFYYRRGETYEELKNKIQSKLEVNQDAQVVVATGITRLKPSTKSLFDKKSPMKFGSQNRILSGDTQMFSKKDSYLNLVTLKIK